MNKEINYTGYTAQPSDYECPDGSLALSLNVISEDNQLKPIPEPKEVYALSQSQCDVLFIHKTNSFTHYIIFDKSTHKIGWYDSEKVNDVTWFTETYFTETFSHVNAIGNTLLVFSERAINYYLWSKKAYKSLGTHLPDIQLSMGLVGHPRLYSMADESKNTFKVTFAEGIKDNVINSTFSEKNKTSITEQVMAKVNKFVANETVNKGRFCFPFLVRYALRLYDGTLTCHSAPILMSPSTTACPVVLWNRLTGKKDTYTEATLDIMLVAASMDYRICETTDSSYLMDWSDIIKSVDIFISKPLYSYDQNGQCSSFSDSDNFQSKFVGRLFHKKANTTTGFLSMSSDPHEDTIIGPAVNDNFLNAYAEWPFSQIYALYFKQNRTYPGTTLHLPEFSDDKELENIRNCSQFYKLCSLTPKEIWDNRSVRTDIKIDDEYLQSLVTREVMTDEYLSHDGLRADYSYTYNNRLNIGSIRRKLFRGFTPQGMFAYVSGFVSCKYNFDDNNKINITYNQSGYQYQSSITVYIKENGKDYQVSVGSMSLYGVNIADFFSQTKWTEITRLDGKEETTYDGLFRYHWPCYFFYPNVNAYKMVFYGSGNKAYCLDLKPHDFLNGAYAVLDYNNVREDNSASFTPPDVAPYNPAVEDNIVEMQNKVFTSEVNNPFFFPVTGINTIGTGKMYGLCTAAKALSQGQFGQFPLYAFTDEGVWAMEVSSTGTYTAKQPITRDVCINPDGITQIDSAVLFPTKRGIMLISGSNVQCLSDIINTNTPFEVCHTLPQMDKLHQMMGEKHQLYDADGNAIGWDSCIPTQPFLEFLESCRMVYDYVHQRIIVYNSSYTYAYVYSMKSQQWGMIHSDIKSNLNSYPEALAVTHGGKVIDFCKDTDIIPPCLLVTRPLKLDNANVLKTVDTIIQRGNFRKGHVQSVLYGSRDLVNWHLVWSSKDHYLRGFRGTPYKYYRIALLCNLNRDESIFGASVQFTPKLINQPR